MSSVVNPFLYSLLSKRFRRGYQDLLRKIKIWILNLPIFLPQPPNSSSNRNDNNVDPSIDPNKTTPSQQEREGLVNSMCCTGMMVKQSFYRWKTSLKREEEDVRKQHKTQNLLDCQIEVSVYRDELEMKDIPGKEKLNKHPDRGSDSDIFYSVGSSLPMTEKNTTLLFISDHVYEPLSKSEDDIPLHSNNSDSSYYNVRCYNSKRRASESYTRPLINYDLLKKQKSKDKSKSYGNLFPKIKYTMSNAFHNNINSSCIP